MIFMEAIRNICRQSCGNSIFNFVKKSQGLQLTVNSNTSQPASISLDPSYSIKARRVSAIHFFIFGVFTQWNVSQVFSSIINFVMVNMVNLVTWPMASIHKPYNSVGPIGPAAEEDSHIATDTYSPRFFARSYSAPRGFSPEQFPRLFIIPKKFMCQLVSNHGTRDTIW